MGQIKEYIKSPSGDEYIISNNDISMIKTLENGGTTQRRVFEIEDSTNILFDLVKIPIWQFGKTVFIGCHLDGIWVFSRHNILTHVIIRTTIKQLKIPIKSFLRAENFLLTKKNQWFLLNNVTHRIKSIEIKWLKDIN